MWYIFVVQEVAPAFGDIKSAAVVENNVTPTCKEAGSYDSVIYCGICKEELSRETKIVAALGHSKTIDAAVAPTCIKTGLTEGSHCLRCNEVLVAQEEVAALDHYYQVKSDISNYWTECVCGDQTAKEEHCGGAADETHRAICEVCGTEYGDFIVIKNEDTSGCASSVITSLYGLLVLGGFALFLKKHQE